MRVGFAPGVYAHERVLGNGSLYGADQKVLMASSDLSN